MATRKVLHGGHFQEIQVQDIPVPVTQIEPVVQVEPDKGEEQMVDDILNDDFLVDVPDIPMPEDGAQDTDVLEDDVEGAFKFAFIGIGQGGGRIAESFWKLGYRRVCCINTNTQDLAGIDIPAENKLVMDIGSGGGAGKDMAKGDEAAKKSHEDIYDLMRRSFGRSFDRILVCIGAGGGTGSGGVSHVIEIAHEIATTFKLESAGTPPAVGVIVSMPKVSEGGKVNANANAVLENLFVRVGNDRGKLSSRTISPLVIIDNDKIDQIYPNLPVAKFWNVANANISGLFHLFNSIACRDSDYTTFDKADLKDVLDSGVLTFGACPLKSWSSATDISHAIRDNLRRNVLVGGFDLSQASSAACVFIANGDVLQEVPQGHLEHGFEMMSRIMKPGSVVHRGIYQGAKPGLVVYTILAELGKPEERMSEIARVGGVTVKK